jgi:hypothetical protein
MGDSLGARTAGPHGRLRVSAECSHESVEFVRRLYVDGRPLYRCVRCYAHITYEGDPPSLKALANVKVWGPERMRHDPERRS